MRIPDGIRRRADDEAGRPAGGFDGDDFTTRFCHAERPGLHDLAQARSQGRHDSAGNGNLGRRGSTPTRPGLALHAVWTLRTP